MHDTRPEAITLHALHHIHDELSPLLGDVEVLLDLCQDCEGDSSQARERASTLHTVLAGLASQLRIQLDTLCYADSGGTMEPDVEKGEHPCRRFWSPSVR